VRKLVNWQGEEGSLVALVADGTFFSPPTRRNFLIQLFIEEVSPLHRISEASIYLPHIHHSHRSLPHITTYHHISLNMHSSLFSLFSFSILMTALYAQSASSQPTNVTELMKEKVATSAVLGSVAVLVPLVGYGVKASRYQSKIMAERDQKYERARKLIADALNSEYKLLKLNVDEACDLAELPNMSDQQSLTLQSLGSQLVGVRVVTPPFDDERALDDESTLDEKMPLDSEMTVTVMKACCNIGIMKPLESEEMIEKFKGGYFRSYGCYLRWTVRDVFWQPRAVFRQPRVTALLKNGNKPTDPIIYEIQSETHWMLN